MANSHITISGLDDQFVTVINANITYYISTTGSDNNSGASDSPWRTLGKAFSVLRDKKISKTATVTINIADVINLAEGDYQESEIIIDHPDGERIEIVGQTPITITANNYNYYQTNAGSSYGGAAYSATVGNPDTGIGGYYMEIGVSSTTNVTVGDIAVIKEQNYTPESILATTVGVSGHGPTSYETDLGGTGDIYMATGQEGLSGNTAQGVSVSLRKFLAVGAHEIVATGGTTINPCILVHVRHDNQSYESGLTSGATKTDGFITPQGIAYSTTEGAIGILTSAYVGEATRGSNTILSSGGDPYGATGAVPMGAAFAEAGLTACGRAYEPILTAAKQRHSNISSIQVYRSRLNFDGGNGLVVKNGGRLGKISNVVILGKGHDVGGGTYEFTSGLTGMGIGVMNNSSCTIENVAISGFDYGVYVDKSKVYGTGLVASANNYGLYSVNTSSVSADYCLWTGNSFGVFCESSDLDSHYNIYSGNHNDGLQIKKNSNANIVRSVSTFNGRYGFYAAENSFMGLGGSTGAYTGNSREGATSDFAGVFGFGNGISLPSAHTSVFRFGVSTRDGCISFRNGSYGMQADDISAISTNANKVSFNFGGGVRLRNHSTLNTFHGNYFNNGITHALGNYANGLTTDGINVSQKCTANLYNSSVIHNRRGVIAADSSSVRLTDTHVLNNYLQVGAVLSTNVGISGCTFAYPLAGLSFGYGTAVNISGAKTSNIHIKGTTLGVSGISLAAETILTVDSFTDGTTGTIALAGPGLIATGSKAIGNLTEDTNIL